MPPMTSRRPGARATTTSVSRSNRPRAGAKGSLSSAWIRLMKPAVSPAPMALASGIRRPGALSLAPGANPSQQPPPPERVLQPGLDLRADPLVRVPHPGDVGLDREQRVERFPMRVGNDHAQLPGDQFGGEIVGVTADPERPAVASKVNVHQRADVRHESVVTRHELIELPAGGDVLILEEMGFAGLRRTECREHDF